MIRDRMIGAVIAGAIAVVATGLMTIAGSVGTLSAALAIPVGAAIGAVLGPSVRTGTWVRLSVVGGAAGFLVLPGYGLLAGLGRYGHAVATGAVALQDAPSAFVGVLVHPILYVVFGFPAVPVLVPAGIAWALLTHQALPFHPDGAQVALADAE